jgi:ribosomal protein S18 acetylase RimI-like enzyme
MNDLPESLFANPVWHALHGKHRHFAAGAGDACRYPADVTPFAAVAAPSALALRQLHSLLAPGESVWIIGDRLPRVPGLSFEGTLPCLQMVLPRGVAPRGPTIEIVQLSSSKAHEMGALTNLAFPGFFRNRTPEMGSYYGVRVDGELVAMGGERLRLDGYPEISGICTHPAHRGKGLATNIIWQLASMHRRDGLVSWLQVAAANRDAIDLYVKMGFRPVREVTLHRVSRR